MPLVYRDEFWRMSQLRRTKKTGSMIKGSESVRSFIDFEDISLVLKFQEGRTRKWVYQIFTPTSMSESGRIQKPDELKIKESNLEATIIITQIDCTFEELQIEKILSDEAGKFTVHHKKLEGSLNIMLNCHDRVTAEKVVTILKNCEKKDKLRKINLCSA